MRNNDRSGGGWDGKRYKIARKRCLTLYFRDARLADGGGGDVFFGILSTMAYKRKTITKLASLSAIGVTAMVSGEAAKAGSVVYSGVINEHVGFNGSAKSFSATLGAAGKFKFATHKSNPGTTGNLHIWKVDGTGAGGGLMFAAESGHMQIFGAGATWGARSASGAPEIAGKRFFGLNTFSHSTGGGNAHFTDEYALIHFGSGAGEYGWIELSLAVNNAGGSSGTNGPNLTIVSYAYDTNGAILPAGSMTGLPEPSTFELSGLAALALGAAGVRRWRAARARKVV
jgi:hypothetical protein